MKLKHSLVYSSSSGPVHGGLVSSGANGSTLCLRTRKRVGMSNKQSQRRVAFLRIVSAWRTLSKINVARYNNFALSLSRSNHFSGKRTLTGFQLFHYVQSMRLLIPQPLFTTWSFFVIPMTMRPISFVWSVPLSNVLFNFFQSGVSSHNLLIFATAGLTSSSKIAKKNYRYIVTIYNGTVSPLAMRIYYSRVFSQGFISGTYISFKVVPFSISGEPYYPPQFFQCLIP